MLLLRNSLESFMMCWSLDATACLGVLDTKWPVDFLFVCNNSMLDVKQKLRLTPILSSLLINNSCSFSVLCRIASVFLLINLNDVSFQDNVFVTVVASVQYRAMADKAADAFYKLSNTKAQIQAYVFDGV